MPKMLMLPAAMLMLAKNSTLTYAHPALLIRACTSQMSSCESRFPLAGEDKHCRVVSSPFRRICRLV